MTEYNIFCWSKNFNDENSFQQKRFRVFNQEVSESRYKDVRNVINAIINSSNTTKLADLWKNLTDKQILGISKLPEFDAEGFKFITGRDVPTVNNFSGKKVKIILDGREYSATVD